MDNKIMKKFVLSFSVILTFIAFGIHQRNEESDVRVVGGSNPMGQTAIPSMVPRMQGGMMGRIYKDGTFTGDATDAFYGNIQVKAIITGGKISDVVFLQYPNDRSTSREINAQAMPLLKSEAIVAQSASVDIVSGATDSSKAFRTSLNSALALAQ